MAIKRIVMSRSPMTGRYTITKEDTAGHIRTTEVETFKQAARFIMMCADDEDFARRVCEKMAEHYENIIREEKDHESRNQSRKQENQQKESE